MSLCSVTSLESYSACGDAVTSHKFECNGATNGDATFTSLIAINFHHCNTEMSDERWF